MKFEEHRDYNRLKVAFDLLNDCDGTRILDIGCGKDALLEQQLADCDVIGLDISQTALLKAKKNAPHSAFILADTRHLPIKDASIDKVAMLAVLGGVPRGEEAVTFAEVRRVLKDGGYLLLHVSQKWLPYSLLAPDRVFGGWKWRHFNFELLERQLNESGFNINKAIFAGGILSLTISTINFFWVNFWHFFSHRIIHRPFLPPLPYRWLNRLSAWEYHPFKGIMKGTARYIYLVAQKTQSLIQETD